MRNGRTLVFGAMSAAAISAGCFAFDRNAMPDVTSSPIERTSYAAAADRVILDYRLVDQPAGDPFATDGIWDMARSFLTHEQEALLAENGLRVGLISGVVAPEFLSRVTTERYLIDPRAYATKPGEEKIIPINGPVERASIRVVRDWKTADETLQAMGVECGLAVTGMPAERNQIQFTCEPAIQFGEKQAWLRPSADRTQFVWDRSKTKDPFSTLSWQIVLGAGDYLIVGPTSQPSGTLGELFFFAAEPARVRQRFLVIRGRVESTPVKSASSIAARAAE
jgi:hypothetical protein